MPNPKHATKTNTAPTEAALTHSHQRLRVSVRLDTVATLRAPLAEGSNERTAEGVLSGGASRIGFTNNFPKQRGWGSCHSRLFSESLVRVRQQDHREQHLDVGL